MPRLLSEKYFQKFEQIKKDILGDDARAKRRAVTALHDLRLFRKINNGKAIGELFLRALKDEDEFVRERAAKALNISFGWEKSEQTSLPKQLGREITQTTLSAFPALIEAIADKNREVRYYIILLLGDFADDYHYDIRRAVPALVERLTDKIESVAWAAARTLEFFSKKREPALIVQKALLGGGLETSSNKDIKELLATIEFTLSGGREKQRQELEKIQKIGSKKTQFSGNDVEYLTSQVKIADYKIRFKAVEKLLSFGPKGQVPLGQTLQKMEAESKDCTCDLLAHIQRWSRGTPMGGIGRDVNSILPFLLRLYPQVGSYSQIEIQGAFSSVLRQGGMIEVVRSNSRFEQIKKNIQKKEWGKIQKILSQKNWISTWIALAACESSLQEGADLRPLWNVNVTKKIFKDYFSSGRNIEAGVKKDFPLLLVLLKKKKR